MYLAKITIHKLSHSRIDPDGSSEEVFEIDSFEQVMCQTKAEAAVAIAGIVKILTATFKRIKIETEIEEVL